MSRVRQVTEPGMPTSGHVLSHSPEEIREALKDIDTDHLLVLDDTSFSGTTSFVSEKILRQAFPDREIDFTHGFLIMNHGKLGNQPGAAQHIRAAGSVAIGGTIMRTPRDDGWHLFDIVTQHNLPDHLQATMELVRAEDHSRPEARVKEILADPERRSLLFPEAISTDELLRLKQLGRFVVARDFGGELHSRNPQLLPTIIKQGHLRHPDTWKLGEQATLNLFVQLNALFERSKT